MFYNTVCFLGSILLATTEGILAFSTTAPPTLLPSRTSQLITPIKCPSKLGTKLQMSYYDNKNNNRSNNSFDLSKPTFDLFSLRTIRNDALLQYSSLNQSEPLRINLYLIGTIGLLSFPSISEAVIGEEANIQSIIASTLLGIGSFGLFLNECKNRLNQLIRIEKEMNAEYLELSLSTKNKLNPKLFDDTSTSTTLKTLRSKKRIVAISGTTDELKDILLSFRVFRHRMNQADSIVVPLATDVDYSNAKDVKEWWKALDITETEIRSCQWIAQPQNIPAWKEYFDNLVEETKKDDNENKRESINNSKLVWFGLNYNGRSFASGSGVDNSPLLLQILGRNLRPICILDEFDEPQVVNSANKEVTAIVAEIQLSQERFYKTLTEGNIEDMNSIYSNQPSDEVSEVLNVGGRIDDWTRCLADGARPENMKTSGSDVLVVSPSVAYSTCIEFPVVDGGGYDNASSFGATLLAAQRWGKDSNTNEWKLEYHSTIPWSNDTRAGGVLRCDCRGCVALTRGPERKTFGGIVG